jgi:DNA-binding MarR family transcriptional regulator
MTASTLQHEIGKRKAFEHPEVEAYLNLLRTTSRLAHDTERLFKRHDLSAATYNVLRILRGHRLAAAEAGRRFEGISCATIAEQLVTPAPDLTRLVDRLHATGFVGRARSKDDRRVVLVTITRKGLNVLTKLDAPLLALHQHQLGHLTRSELAELSRLLVKARRSEGT